MRRQKTAYSKKKHRRPKFVAGKKQIGVSDHALLRYLERCEGRDLAALRARILPPELFHTIEILGDCKIPAPFAPGEFEIVIRNRVVVTIQAI